MAAVIVIDAGQLTAVGVVSSTLTVCVAAAETPLASVGVIVVMLTGKKLLAGTPLCVMVTALKPLSLALAAPNVASLMVTPQVVAPVPVETVMGGGAVIVGGVESLTVKVVVQVLTLLAASFTVTVIVVTPEPAIAPAAGLCVMINKPTAVQLSEAVTLQTPLARLARHRGFCSLRLQDVEAITVIPQEPKVLRFWKLRRRSGSL